MTSGDNIPPSFKRNGTFLIAAAVIFAGITVYPRAKQAWTEHQEDVATYAKIEGNVAANRVDEVFQDLLSIHDYKSEKRKETETTAFFAAANEYLRQGKYAPAYFYLSAIKDSSSLPEYDKVQNAIEGALDYTSYQDAQTAYEAGKLDKAYSALLDIREPENFPNFPELRSHISEARRHER